LVPGFARQGGSQRGAAAGDPALHGAGRDVEDGSYVGVVEVSDVAEHDR
jgi:hypothetical protein